MQRYSLYFLTLLVFTALSHSHLVAVEYEIEPIATDLATVPGSDEAPVILSNGRVYYLLDHRLMSGDGNSSNEVYESKEGSDIPPYSVQSLSFNSQGDFIALCRAGSRQSTLVLWRSEETRILDRRPALMLGPPDINDNGSVAYAVRNDDRVTQVLLHDGQTHQAVAKSTSLIGLSVDAPSINNLEQIAVTSRRAIHLIDTSQDKPTAKQIVFDQSLGGFDGAILNDIGQVVFRVKRPGIGIHVAKDGRVDKVVDTSGKFASLGKPSFNNKGNVAFMASLNDGNETIQLDIDGSLHRIVSTGDTIGDSTVTTIRFSTQGLNDNGQVCFWAMLLDGTEGIYRATPSRD